MKRLNTSRARQFIIMGLLVFIAWLCRIVMKTGLTDDYIYAYLRDVIYLVMFSLWGLSISGRVIQKEAGRYLRFMALLMVFWFVIRTVKYDLIKNPYTDHWCWYLYYIPLLVLPVYVLFVSRSICNAEHYQIPKGLKYLYIPAILLIILVLTNDLHNLVFILPADRPPMTADSGYSYGIVAYIIMAWRILCYAAAIYFVFTKNRMSTKRQRIILPIGIILILGVYLLLYSVNVPFISIYFGDMPSAYIICLILFIESLLGLGLIQGNSHYVELFRHAGLPAVIADDGGKSLIATAAYTTLPPEILRRADKAPAITPDGMRVSCAPLEQGKVYWQEDISGLIRLNKRLESVREELKERNQAETETYRAQREERQIAERNRLYDKLQEENRYKVRQLSELVEQLENLGNAVNAGQERGLLLRISVIGAYIKRRNNLSFLKEDHEHMPARELYHCLEQSLESLTIFGIENAQDFRLTADLPIEVIIRLYEIFEEVVEYALDTLSELFLSLSEKENEVIMSLRICTEEKMSELVLKNGSVVEDGDGEWLISCRIERGGGSV